MPFTANPPGPGPGYGSALGAGLAADEAPSAKTRRQLFSLFSAAGMGRADEQWNITFDPDHAAFTFRFPLAGLDYTQRFPQGLSQLQKYGIIETGADFSGWLEEDGIRKHFVDLSVDPILEKEDRRSLEVSRGPVTLKTESVTVENRSANQGIYGHRPYATLTVQTTLPPGSGFLQALSDKLPTIKRGAALT